MQFSWQYPIYLIPHGMGYVSIVDPEGGDQGAGSQPRQLLVILTDEDRAAEFMDDFQLTGLPRKLENDREFSWLLRGLKHPVTQVAFDPRPRDGQVNSRITLGVQELLDGYLDVDFSPWNYPVFVIAQEEGFASILQQASPEFDLAGRTAVSLFTDAEKAEAYLEATGEQGTLCELADMELTRRFLEALSEHVSAVALNPRYEEGGLAARHAFSLTTLLEKYLVHEQ